MQAMKYGVLAGAAFVFCLIVAAYSMLLRNHAHAQTADRPPPNTANYHGTNALQPGNDLATGRRRFEPGAHSAWHVHPGGQLIVVEEGTAVVQRLGEPLQVLHTHDADFTLAGVPHWHGSAPHEHAVTSMVHFGGIGPWLEPVSYEEYTEQTRLAGLPAFEPPADAPPPGNYVGMSTRLASDHLQAARGRFEADAWSFWHVHPAGQAILAEQGPVILQERDKPMQILREGEAGFTAPGVPHWHGAGPYSYALMVVLGYGAETQWLGEPVSEEAYAEARRFFAASP
jgi:quercetin dioxygenase-like cupin family protein